MALSVSIIVPVYNVEKYIADCFQSIINQTYSGPMECLFIDDCGTDNSVQLLEGLIKAYDGPIKLIIIHHQQNSGPSVARNSGIKNSKGDYIFFMDSDDILYPDSIKSLVNAVLQENGTDVVLGSYKVSNPEHTINRFKYEHNVIKAQPAIAKEFLCDNLYCMLPNKLVRKSFIFENQLWLTSGLLQGEDNLWSFQAFHMARKVVTIPEITYYYVVHSNSITTSIDREKQIICAMRICEEVKKDLNNHRYELIENDSQNYLDNLMKTKCGGLLNQIYTTGLNREQRLTRLKAIPKDLKSSIEKYLFTSSAFMTVIRILFQCRCYGMFDQVMTRMYSRNVME